MANNNSEKKNKFAECVWTVNDIKTLRPKWSNKKCEQFLIENEKAIQDEIIQHGWRVIESLLY